MNQSPWRQVLFVFAFASIFGGGALLWYVAWRTSISRAPSTDSSGPMLRKPEAILTPNQYFEAESWVRENRGTESPRAAEVYLAAAGLALEQDDLERAAKCFAQIPTNDPLGLTARLQQGITLAKMNDATKAEQSLREFLDAARQSQDVKPEQVLDGFKWLTFLLSIELRQEERHVILKEQHAIGLADPLDSKQLYFPNLLILNSPVGKSRIEKFLERDLDNPTILAAKARYKTFSGEYDSAIEILKGLQSTRPEDLVVAAALAEAYFESDKSDEFEMLMEKLPPYSKSEPWLLTRMRGEFALLKENWNRAVEMFRIVLEEDPANSAAQMGMSTAYQSLSLPEQHQDATHRSSVLAKIRANLRNVQADAEAACIELAEQCGQIGMKEAARVFLQHAKSFAKPK